MSAAEWVLDLFCGEGGAAAGYARAGYRVFGVDLEQQDRYPFGFHRGDALDFLARWGASFDLVHASPPCKRFTKQSACRPGLVETYPDLLTPTRAILAELGVPYVIENVPGAPLRRDFELCGCQFGLVSSQGLQVRRTRWFEVEPQAFALMPAHHHYGPALPAAGHSPGKDWRRQNPTLEPPGADERRAALEVPWMSRDGLAECIPPAFTEYIGNHVRAARLERAA